MTLVLAGRDNSHADGTADSRRALSASLPVIIQVNQAFWRLLHPRQAWLLREEALQLTSISRVGRNNPSSRGKSQPSTARRLKDRNCAA